MSMNEADTRAKLIDPALHQCGWTEDLIKREETAGTVDIVDGKASRSSRGRVDYLLRVKADKTAHPVAIALIEAKAEHLPPSHGLQQGKTYADSKRLNVPFVFSSNGHLFVEYDRFTGKTAAPLPIAQFPSPDTLRARYEAGMGFSLSAPAAKPLLMPYSGGDSSRRYYQDAAIRAVLEKIAKGDSRALLSLATGAGKTRIAVQLLQRIAAAGQLRRALFVCDRDELRGQGAAAFQAAFGTDAAQVSSGKPQTNARILIATYQTLGLASDTDDATFLTTHYPPDYFSHILIDECHRSAWGKWSLVLTRNPNAIQVGLTATPRQLVVNEKDADTQADAQITADNYKHFGEPVYEYDMAQGIEDGYLAACEIVKRTIFLDEKTQAESETGIGQSDLAGKALTDANTGAPINVDETRERYDATSFEQRLLLPERVQAMSADLFAQLLETGTPKQKSIIFCASDRHADLVATALNNLYAQWCKDNGQKPADAYAFKCTAASSGNDFLPDLRGSSNSHFIATTVDLLTTGVDVPGIRNVVFFKYVRSPISFYQMVGRGTRLDPTTGKLMFRVYDYTNATRLFGKEFRTKLAAPSKPPQETEEKEPVIQVEGFDVRITPAGRFIVTMVDGKAQPITVEEYREQLAAKLTAEAPTLETFRSCWINPAMRRDLLQRLPGGERSPAVLRTLESMGEFDLYDVLAEVGYGMAPRTREERADAFGYKHADWLRACPSNTAATIRALARQFARSGTEGLENRSIFQLPDVKQAGGLAALQALGEPADVLRETKERMFAA